MCLYKTNITAIGEEVSDLLEGGVLILYEDGAPAELAEVSVLHKVQEQSDQAPTVGSTLKIGAIEVGVTAIGETAWSKVQDIGHVVINFNGADEAMRPGEICAGEVDPAIIRAELQSGKVIELVA